MPPGISQHKLSTRSYVSMVPSIPGQIIQNLLTHMNVVLHPSIVWSSRQNAALTTADAYYSALPYYQCPPPCMAALTTQSIVLIKSDKLSNFTCNRSIVCCSHRALLDTRLKVSCMESFGMESSSRSESFRPLASKPCCVSE